jgi:hypothetical protein
MKTREVFETQDGRRFDRREDAAKHEEMLSLVSNCNKQLPYVQGNDLDFLNGGGCIQHTGDDIHAFKEYLRRLLFMEGGDKYVEMFDKQPDGIIGRYLDDSGSLLYRLWGRLANIDSQGREWGQYFYKLHPEKAKHQNPIPAERK